MRKLNFVLFTVLSQWHLRLGEMVSLADFIQGFYGIGLHKPLNVFFPYIVARWHLYVFVLYSSLSFLDWCSASLLC